MTPMRSPVKLGEVAEFIRGITFKPDDIVSADTEGAVACMRTKNVQAELDLTDVWSIGRDFVRRSEQFLRPGDTLVSSANSWNLVGKCCWIPELPRESTFGGFVSVLRPKSDRLNPRYLYHWFSSPRTQATVRSFSRQTTNIANLDLSRCLKLDLALPALGEQQRIAEVLDRANGLRATRREALADLDDLARSVFLEMFARRCEGWQQFTVGELAAVHKGAIRTGPFGSQLLHEEFVDSGIAVLGIDNVVSNRFSWRERRFITQAKYQQLKRYTVHPGDVLVTIMGTCGRCAIVPDDIPVAINTKHLCCITLDQNKCLPEFLHAYFLRHPDAQSYLQRTAKGAIMSGLNMEIIKALPVSLPPLEMQKDFAYRIQAIHKAREVHEGHLAELDALFEALQDRAFRGGL